MPPLNITDGLILKIPNFRDISARVIASIQIMRGGFKTIIIPTIGENNRLVFDKVKNVADANAPRIAFIISCTSQNKDMFTMLQQQDIPAYGVRALRNGIDAGTDLDIEEYPNFEQNNQATIVLLGSNTISSKFISQ